MAARMIAHAPFQPTHQRAAALRPTAKPRVVCRAAPGDAATRRQALQGLLAALAASAAGPALAGAEGGARLGEIRHTDAEWQEILTKNQYAVLRTAATEPRFSSPLVEEHRKGTFKCGGCGSPLFASEAKYESGTGWPSFVQALPGAVDEMADKSIPFMSRVEVRCHRCQGHLGHVFEDGPPELTGLRYCMNGLALTFEPASA